MPFCYVLLLLTTFWVGISFQQFCKIPKCHFTTEISSEISIQLARLTSVQIYEEMDHVAL